MKREEQQQPKRAKQPESKIIKYELEIEPESYTTSFWKKEQISKEKYFKALNRQIDSLINMGKFKL